MRKKNKSIFGKTVIQTLSPEVSKMLASGPRGPMIPVELMINGEPSSSIASPVASFVVFRGYDLAKPGCAQVTINGRPIPQDAWMSTIVQNGDDIKILPLGKPS